MRRSLGLIATLAPAVLLPLAPAGAQAPLSPAPALHEFEVTAGPGARELRVEARIAPGRDGPLCVQEGYGAYVSDLELGRGAALAPVPLEKDCIRAEQCERAGCRLRYRFALAEAAAKSRKRSRAFEHEGTLLSPPGTWLLSPTEPRPGSRYRLSVKTPPEIVFVNGATPARGVPNRYEGLTGDLMDGPYAGFGAFEFAGVATGGGAIEVAITPGERAVASTDIVDWVRAAGDNVSSYFGRFPLPRALVIVLVGGRRGVGYGSSMGHGGASVMISVGRAAGSADLREDWVLTHELSHLALPNVARQHHWLEEGMATYVELVARTRSGILSSETLWRDLMNGLPNGAAAAAERGLDGAGGWASTYWGGALYWFLADTAIREQTANRMGLEHALRGIMAEGTIADAWNVERVLRTGDEATGTRVLQDLYSRMGRGAHAVDLAARFKLLGVERRGAGVGFDEEAPLAPVRRAIGSAPPRSASGT